MNESRTITQMIAIGCSVFCWRRGAGSNRRIKVLQTSALPLGYRAGTAGGLPVNTGLLFAPYRAALAEVNIGP
jgi:hypothetical protein